MQNSVNRKKEQIGKSAGALTTRQHSINVASDMKLDDSEVEDLKRVNDLIDLKNSLTQAKAITPRIMNNPPQEDANDMRSQPVADSLNEQ